MMKKLFTILLIIFAFITVAVCGSVLLIMADEPKDWQTYITKLQNANIPEPQKDMVWRYDVKKAFDVAKQTGRPVFVTMRCLPCKQCSIFDKTILDGGPELDPLFKQFITVRLTSAHDLDLNIFPVEDYQDLDLSWWGWFFSPEGEIYSVFGGRDHVSDETRISKEALVNTMQRVLQRHYSTIGSQITPERKEMLSKSAYTPKELPGFESWLSKRSHEADPAGCIHCHQVREILWQPAIDQKTFDKHNDTQTWPLPENTGITLDRDHGLMVTSVDNDCPAETAGIRTGDVLLAANGTPLFSQTDFRAVLHRAHKKNVVIEVVWQRGGEIHSGTMKMKEGWRATNMDWRMSVSQGNFSTGPGFFPLAANDNDREKHSIIKDQMAVRPFLGDNPIGPAFQAGLRGGDIITSVNGESPNVAGRAFLVWLRMRYEPGDELNMTAVSSNGESKKVTYTLQKREVY